jgi:hypothetical protein
LRLSRNLYDGAGNGQHFGIFHEARRFFIFRFQATDVTTTGLEQSLTRFRMPFSSSHLAVSTDRNEFGLWRRSLSQQQQEFFLSKSKNPDAVPPEDQWTRTKGIEFFRKDGSPGNPASEAEMAKGALLEIDPEKTAKSLESLLLQPPVRNSAADSGLVAREKFAVLEELCRRLLD